MATAIAIRITAITIHRAFGQRRPSLCRRFMVDTRRTSWLCPFAASGGPIRMFGPYVIPAAGRANTSYTGVGQCRHNVPALGRVSRGRQSPATASADLRHPRDRFTDGGGVATFAGPSSARRERRLVLVHRPAGDRDADRRLLHRRRPLLQLRSQHVTSGPSPNAHKRLETVSRPREGLAPLLEASSGTVPLRPGGSTAAAP
jgi:hypothetical protein